MDLRPLTNAAYDRIGRRLLVGRPLVNRVGILGLPRPPSFADGFEAR